MQTTPSTSATGLRASGHARRRLALAGLSLVAVAALAACGDDTDDDAAEPAVTTTVADAPSTVTVRLVDYGFEDVPTSVPAGTKLEIINESDKELHELVAFRLADDEQRPLSELLALPEAEAMSILGEPATVLLQAPGGGTIPAVGDGTLAEPGRYVLMCAIPTGADPAAYLEAAAASQGGPPEVAGGPPHFLHGMVTELTVD
jgi:hypothetical protein